MFSRTFDSDMGQFQFTLPNILFVFDPFFHPGFWFFGLPLLFFFRQFRWHRDTVLIATCIFVFLIFIAGMASQNNRFFVVIMPLAALFAYPLFYRLMSRLKQWNPSAVLPVYSILLVAQLGLCGYAFTKTYDASQKERTIATAFEELSGKTVYSYGIDQSLRHYNKNNTFISLYLQDGLNPEAGTYFLFDHSWLGNSQVKGLFQVKLWRQLSKANRLRSVQRIGTSWELYEVL